jgi:NCS1 family nucleobase:cation symporter-1
MSESYGTSVCIVAIWPSFAQISNGLPASLPTTTYEMIGFFVFWAFSLPFLFIRPEKFKTPFMFTSIFCGLSMIGIMIWSLAVAKGVGPIFTKGEALPENSAWNTAWLMMSGINSAMGQKAAGMTNASDFSRYAKRRRDYLIGTISCYGITGVLVSFAGLITTGACQKIYGTIYWNPPDLMMRIMEGKLYHDPILDSH